MAFQLLINTVDYSNYYIQESVSIEEGLQVRGSTMNLDIYIFNAEVSPPLGGQEIVFTRDGTREFAGRISEVTISQLSGPLSLRYSLSCIDFTVDLDATLINAKIASQLAGDMIREVVAQTGRGVTTNNTEDGITVEAIDADYMEPSAIISRIAEAIEHQWYIDFDRDLNFFFIVDRPAPLAEIDVDNDTDTYHTISFIEQWERVRNRIIITGAKAKSTNQDSITSPDGDGSQKFWPLNYEPWNIDDVTVTLDGTPQTLLLDTQNGQAGDGLGSAGQFYVCLAAGQQVITDLGYKPIESLVSGDKVLTHKGQFMPVVSTFDLDYMGDLYSIKRFGHVTPIEATADHRILVVRESNAVVPRYYQNGPRPKRQGSELGILAEGLHEFISASEVRVGDFLIEPIPQAGQDRPEFTTDLAWLAGIYLAEGTTQHCMAPRQINPTMLASFGLHHNELDTLGKRLQDISARYFGASYLVTDGIGARGNGAVLRARVNPALVGFLERFGRGSHNKFIPQWVFELPDIKTVEFIRGMWEGDGCIKASGVASYCSVSFDLADGFRRLLLKHSIIGNLRSEEGAARLPNGSLFQRKRYVVYIDGDQADKFAALMGLDPTLANPKNRRRIQLNNAVISGRFAYYKIQEIAKRQFAGRVYDIEVMYDHTFVTVAVQSNCL